MSVVVADSVVGGGTGTAPSNVTVTLPGGAPSVGEVLVLVVGANAGSDATKPASGQGGVTTWSELISTVRRSTQIWYGVVDGTPSASVVYNNNYRLIGYHALLRVQGLDTASLIHGTPLAANGQSEFPTAGAFTPTGGANVWLLTACATSTGGTPGGISSSTPSGWTELHSTTFGPLAYVEIASASGAYSLTWDTNDANRSWDAQLVAFNVASSGTIEEADGDADGVATVTGVGVAVAAGVGAAAGVATPAGVSGATAGSVGSADGTATPTAVSGATAGVEGAAAGAATTDGVSGATAGSAGASAGVATGAAVGAATVAGVGSADGVADPTAVSGATAGVVGSSAGVATVAGVGEDANATGSTGSADGVATATGVGVALWAGVGASAGVATPVGVGAATAQGVGSADGGATAAATASATAATVGSASGAATVSGVVVYYVLGVGSASGLAVCLAEGEDGAALPVPLLLALLRGQPRYAATPDGGPRYEGTLQ